MVGLGLQKKKKKNQRVTDSPPPPLGHLVLTFATLGEWVFPVNSGDDNKSASRIAALAVWQVGTLL